MAHRTSATTLLFFVLSCAAGVAACELLVDVDREKLPAKPLSTQEPTPSASTPPESADGGDAGPEAGVEDGGVDGGSVADAGDGGPDAGT